MTRPASRARTAHILPLAALAAMLGGCDALTAPLRDGPDATRGGIAAAGLVERDVEAPEVFEATEAALWDGRPSLGGVWVAAPGVADPVRVSIRNPANGKRVIGTLFRREPGDPGPRLQLSSDAAAALDVIAGQPAEVAVVALRREEVAVREGAAPAAETPPPPRPAGVAAGSSGASVAAAGDAASFPSRG